LTLNTVSSENQSNNLINTDQNQTKSNFSVDQTNKAKPTTQPNSNTNPSTTKSTLPLTDAPLANLNREPSNSLDITDTQRDKLAEFLKLKKTVGEIVNEDLSVVSELGSGNGGVVLKVRHKSTGSILAKKVARIFKHINLNELALKLFPNIFFLYAFS
jgi:hypothetical protein